MSADESAKGWRSSVQGAVWWCTACRERCGYEWLSHIENCDPARVGVGGAAVTARCGVCDADLGDANGLRVSGRNYTTVPTAVRVTRLGAAVHDCGEPDDGNVVLGVAPRPSSPWQRFWHDYHHGRLMRYGWLAVVRFSWRNRRSGGQP